MNEHTYSKCYLSIAIVVAFVVAAIPSWAGKASPTTMNVKSVIYDPNSSGAMLLRSDDQDAVGQALYDAADPKVKSVISLDGGIWQLYLGNQSPPTPTESKYAVPAFSVS